ncbi:MAG: hypothetical protein ACLQBD_10730, partial [Syntrophobacteraceae bacterium]
NFNAGLSKYSGGYYTFWHGGVLTHWKLLLLYVSPTEQDSMLVEALWRAIRISYSAGHGRWKAIFTISK